MEYNEKAIVIDLISMEFETNDVDFISRMAEDLFDISLTSADILDHLQYVPEDFEKISWTVEMSEIFNEYE